MGKLRSGVRYDIEPDMIGDGQDFSDLSVSEQRLISDWVCDSPNMDAKTCAQYIQRAQGFKHGRARTYIMQEARAWRDQNVNKVERGNTTLGGALGSLWARFTSGDDD